MSILALRLRLARDVSQSQLPKVDRHRHTDLAGMFLDYLLFGICPINVCHSFALCCVHLWFSSWPWHSESLPATCNQGNHYKVFTKYLISDTVSSNRKANGRHARNTSAVLTSSFN